ncbi:LysE family translocator [Acidocella sp.]|uniref:LysE family translocator n=1 Tax=Acidocella sp. TaxID=50710 RepID=UPI0026297FF2|nr:LysE family translocator [Acidocella sp.]
MIVISLPLLLAFIAAAAVLTITPGVDTAMVLRACAAGGRGPGWAAALGICLGCLVWGAAVALGLGAVLRAAPQIYEIVKYAGTAYLVWVGVNLLLHPRRALEAGGAAPRRGAWRAAFRRGLLTDLLNPKIGVFYVTFLPQFIPAGASVAAEGVMLALIHVGMTLGWFAVLIAASAPLAQRLREPRIIAALDRVAGGVFILFGVRLAFSRR